MSGITLGEVQEKARRNLATVGGYRFSLPVGVRRLELCRFCNRAYIRHGHIDRPSGKFPSLFFCIEDVATGAIRGSVGVYLLQDTEGKMLPSEAVFGLSVWRDLGIDPWKVGEICRLTGDGSTFVPTVTFMVRYLYEELALRYALFGVKPFIVRGVRRMGMDTVVHDRLDVCHREEVPEEFLPYFEKPPRPVVATLDLRRAHPVAVAHHERLGCADRRELHAGGESR